MNDDLLESISKNDVISEENFTILHAGEKGGNYVDIDSLLGDSRGREQLSRQIVNELRADTDVTLDDYDVLAFLNKDYGPIGLLPYTSEISNELEKPAVVVQLDDRIRIDRMEIKGINPIKEDLLDGSSVLLIDDVVASGKTQRTAIKHLEKRGATVNGVMCVYARDDSTLEDIKDNDDFEVDYGNSLLTFSEAVKYGIVLSDDPDDYKFDVVDFLQDRYDLDDREREEVRKYLDNQVDDIIRASLEEIVQELGIVDDPSEREAVVDRAMSAFDDDFRQFLRTYLTEVNLYTKNKNASFSD